jgi:hypothetical protein
MTPDRGAGAGRQPPPLGPDAVLAGALAAAALLLFCWPFLAVPRPSLAEAYRHVLASWAATVVLLWWSSRPGRERRARGKEHDG